MATPLYVTPYITPIELYNSGLFTGMGNWQSVGVTQASDLTEICMTVSDMVDNICGSELLNGVAKDYSLRASVNTETAITSERERVMIDKNSNLSYIVSFRPIINLIQMTYQAVPGNGITQPPPNVIVIDGNDLYCEDRMVVAFGFGIGSIPSSTGWGYGYLGGYGSDPLRVSVTYTNGFPNSQNLSATHIGDMSFLIDDPTGIQPGDNMTFCDTVPEIITVSSSYTYGSATVETANPLLGAHPANTRVTELKMDLKQACRYLAMDLIQSRGQSGSTAARKVLGQGAVPNGLENFYEKALELLDFYILTP